jgi:hypothetical protein
MKLIGQFPGSIALIAVLLTGLMFSCRENGAAPDAMAGGSVRDSVGRMMTDIARDLSAVGPGSWLNYFENTKAFYMSVDGRVVFPDHRSAETFIKDTLVKNIQRIDLRWSNIRIDSLDPRIASIGAEFHEEFHLADTNAKLAPEDGYFTAVAERTTGGWQLRNLHWSIPKGK